MTAPATHPGKLGYRPDIDGLRAVAVGSVVLFHAFPNYLPGGFVGVDIFFVISGYLITSILMRERDASSLSIRSFYSRRIKRIVPALALVLVSCLAVGWVILLTDAYTELGKETLSGVLFYSNLYFWSEENYFADASGLKPLLHLWSLGVEEQFYLVWPLVIYVAGRSRKVLLASMAIIASASFLICLYLTSNDATAAFYSPLSRVWQLAVGGLLVFFKPGSEKRTLWGDALAWAGVAAIGLAIGLLRPSSPFPGWWALAPTLGAAALLAAGPQQTANRLLALKPFVWVGLISYPLYLWHWPLLSFALIENQTISPPGSVRAGLVVAAIVLACGTYIFVEKPLRRLNAAALLGGIVLVGLMAALVIGTGGLPGRSVNADPQKRFAAYYHRMPSQRAATYRLECDFREPSAIAAGSKIAPSCTRPGRLGTAFLWGDSHAQALSYGLRRVLPDGYALAQVATSGCSPALGGGADVSAFAGNVEAAQACRDSNRFALSSIRALKPAFVFIAQTADHDKQDWNRIAQELHRLGAKQVVLVGPMPQWLPALPLIVTKYHWPLTEDYISTGLSARILQVDRTLRARYSSSQQLTLVSLVGGLCTESACRARVGRELLVMDYGHLTSAGSDFVARTIIMPALPRENLAGKGGKVGDQPGAGPIPPSTGRR